MNTGWLGWGLVLVAVAVGYTAYGWRGVALALTVTVFWLLLQFSRGVRALRDATGRPIGEVPSVVMLHSKLARGMRLAQVLKLTRSLGRPLSTPRPAEPAALRGGMSQVAKPHWLMRTEPEAYAWADAGGDELRVELNDGRVTRWELKRAAN